MSVCCCALAGTAACRYCQNNPYADPSPFKYVTYVTTGDEAPSRKTRDPDPPVDMNIALCATCKFFKPPEGELVFPVAEREGVCVRNPPSSDKTWPKVMGINECGEWKRVTR